MSVRHVCIGLGVDFSRQRTELLSGTFNCGHMTTVGADGKHREMFCIALF